VCEINLRIGLQRN